MVVILSAPIFEKTKGDWLMELTVYRQAVKERPDGTIIYKGEDARPYVDEEQFFVADGLGGAAAIRHQKIRPEMFDEDKSQQYLSTAAVQFHSFLHLCSVYHHKDFSHP